jgi:BTB/POZ domain
MSIDIPDNLLDFCIIDQDGGAHRTSKVFLYKSSAYFRALFDSMAFIENSSNSVALPYSREHIEVLIEFINPYIGDKEAKLKSLETHEIDELLEIADYLDCGDIKGLIQGIIHVFPLDEDIYRLWKKYNLDLEAKMVGQMLSEAIKRGHNLAFLDDNDLEFIYGSLLGRNFGREEISKVPVLRKCLKRYSPQLSTHCLTNLIYATLAKWGVNIRNKKIVIEERCFSCHVVKSDVESGICSQCRYPSSSYI